MGTRKIAIAALIALAVVSNGTAHDVPRIDGSSAAAAQKSFEQMNLQLSQKRPDWPSSHPSASVRSGCARTRTSRLKSSPEAE